MMLLAIPRQPAAPHPRCGAPILHQTGDVEMFTKKSATVWMSNCNASAPRAALAMVASARANHP